MDSNITKAIIKDIISKIVLNDNDKEFLGRLYTIESYYLYNKTVAGTSNSLIECIKWRNTEMVEYIRLSYTKVIDGIILIYMDGIPTIYYSCNKGNKYNFKEGLYTSVRLTDPLFKKHKKVNIIINCDNMGSELYSDIIAQKNFISTFKKYYLYRINKLFVLNVNPIIKNIIQLLKPCLSEYMQERIYVTSKTNELETYFNNDIIQFILAVQQGTDKPLSEIANTFKLI